MSFKKLSFDKVVGGLRSSGMKKTSSFSQKMKKTKSPGSSEVLEEDVNVTQMNEVDILEEYEKLLENMNLTEEKKEPLRKLSLNQKIEMLTMKSKTKDQAKTKLDSPSDYIMYLSSRDMSVTRISICIESLKVALTNNSLEWVQEFGNDGLKQVLSLISNSFKNGSDGHWEKVQLGCVKCLKSIMNNKVGLQNLFEQQEALTLLAR
jgi:diaphanous 2